MEVQYDINKVWGGIVTYNPDLTRLQENIEAIIPQVSNVLVFDNGSSNVEEIQNLLSNYLECHLLACDINMGMSKALNFLCEVACINESHQLLPEELKPNYLLLLDQDSVASPDMVQNLFKYIGEDIGIVAPINLNRRIPAATYELGRTDPQLAARVNTSGSLLSLEAFINSGGYNDALFVDWVDIEFCLRLRENGYKIIVSPTAFLLHDLGEAEFICKIPWINAGKIVKRSLFRTNHGLQRHYDCARSWAIMLNEHAASPLLKGEKLNILMGIAQRIVTEPNKINMLKCLHQGYLSGLSAVDKKH